MELKNTSSLCNLPPLALLPTLHTVLCLFLCLFVGWLFGCLFICIFVCLLWVFQCKLFNLEILLCSVKAMEVFFSFNGHIPTML